MAKTGKRPKQSLTLSSRREALNLGHGNHGNQKGWRYSVMAEPTWEVRERGERNQKSGRYEAMEIFMNLNDLEDDVRYEC